MSRLHGRRDTTHCITTDTWAGGGWFSGTACGRLFVIGTTRVLCSTNKKIPWCDVSAFSYTCVLHQSQRLCLRVISKCLSAVDFGCRCLCWPNSIRSAALSFSPSVVAFACGAGDVPVLHVRGRTYVFFLCRCCRYYGDGVVSAHSSLPGG